jgi:7-carboxy-7-deazaguanine synthase
MHDAPPTTPAAPDRDRQVRMSEVYVSVQGESTHVGKPCVFVRLTGCNLRCRWCDSTFTFTGGAWRDVDEVAAEAHAYGVRTVEVTGGEPLVQRGAIPLMRRLVALGHEVLLETSGSRSIADVPPEVKVILDLKPPGSGEERANLWSNIELLRPKDEVKFVIASRADFDWAADVVRRHGLNERCPVLFSPVWGEVEPLALVEWILASKLDVRFQLQLHKVLWHPDQRGV